MTAADATTLYDIRRIWTDRYKIDFIDGVWQARQLGGGISILTADTPDQLRGQIRRTTGLGRPQPGGGRRRRYQWLFRLGRRAFGVLRTGRVPAPSRRRSPTSFQSALAVNVC